jgi:polysaccharide export outer membrane protein
MRAALQGLLWGLLVWCGAAWLPEATARAEDPSPGFAAALDYRLGAGDVIDIAVFEVAELSKPAVVSPDGAVLLPLVGAVAVAGLTPREAAQRLRDLYAANLIRDPQISVAVREYHSQPVVVLGAVAKPGVYQLRGPRRLSDVLALAAGLAPDAGSEISIARPLAAGNEQSFEVPVAGLLSRAGRPEHNPWVQAHDTVRVARAGVVYVVGEVVRAGGFPLKNQETMTVLQALSLAEGLKRTAAPQRATILRRAANGAPRETPVKIRDVLAGRAPDPALGPSDVLFVPDSQARTAAGRAAEAAIQITTGVIIWRR